MIEKIIPDKMDDNPNPREYELLPDGTWRMTMEVVDGWFSYDLVYKGREVSELIGFTLEQDGSYSAAIYAGRGEVVIPAEYKGRPVRMTEQPRYPEDASVSDITSLVIPDGVRRICGEAHQYYSRLRTVTLPDTLAEIGRFAFADCDELRELKLPCGLKVIEECAFSECAALERVELPDGLLRIENQAFRYCTSLESVSVPPTVTEIDYEAFFGCEALRRVNLSRTTLLGEDAIPDGVEIVYAD